MEAPEPSCHPPRAPLAPSRSSASHPGSHSCFLMGFEGKEKKKKKSWKEDLAASLSVGMSWRCLGQEMPRRHEEAVKGAQVGPWAVGMYLTHLGDRRRGRPGFGQPLALSALWMHPASLPPLLVPGWWSWPWLHRPLFLSCALCCMPMCVQYIHLLHVFNIYYINIFLYYVIYIFTHF